MASLRALELVTRLQAKGWSLARSRSTSQFYWGMGTCSSYQTPVEILSIVNEMMQLQVQQLAQALLPGMVTTLVQQRSVMQHSWS